jgi:GMP synthase (glutamine-hydrolysing)
LQAFNPEKFIAKQVAQTKKLIGKERALVAVSGGVDSTTSAVLTFKAIGSNLLCVMLDDAFMRDGEPQHIADIVSQPPVKLPLEILDVKERFIKAMEGLKDAEEKRKAFRETFYKVLGETAKKEGCKVLVQGTIKADIDETTGGVKTQHNVLNQMGIDPVKQYGFKVVEPLASLYKSQVRTLAHHFRIPTDIAERQPFPGPGLSVRVVGEIKRDKLDTIKKATVISEKNFAKHIPSQYFAAILDNETTSHSRIRGIEENLARLLNVPSRYVSIKVFEAKATGIKEGKRKYGAVAALKVETMNGAHHQPPISNLIALQAEVTRDPSFTRMLYTIQETPQRQLYVISLRAVNTQDFLTAKVAEIPWTTLNETAGEILKSCSNVSAIYYDVTPKPPATIEME